MQLVFCYVALCSTSKQMLFSFNYSILLIKKILNGSRVELWSNIVTLSFK